MGTERERSRKEVVYEDLYKMFIDIAKYTITAVVISTFIAGFKDNASIVYVIGIGIVITSLVLSLVFLRISYIHKNNTL
jgi:uncharacterized membrane protein (DUF373 family)